MTEQQHTLSFAQLNIIGEGIAELIVNNGVEVTVTMLKEYYDICLSTFNGPFSLLVNKLNSYSYTFEAQNRIPKQEMILATAVVVYNASAEMGTTILSKPTTPWNMKLFLDRAEAIAWLEAEHTALSQ